MGFDQRSHRRIPLSSHIRFWMGAEESEFGALGEALNLSESGLAFTTSRPVEKGERLRVEFKLSDTSGYLRLTALVVHCEPFASTGERWQWRVRFQERSSEALMRMRRIILETTDPKAAASNGWGTAVLKNLPGLLLQYQELKPEQSKGWTEDPGFLKADGIATLPHFQELLMAALGSKAPETLRIKGSLRVKEKSTVWVELALPKGALQLLGEAIWSKQEPEEEAEAGLRLLAYGKEDAQRLDKQH